jgi:hypothetical protein
MLVLRQLAGLGEVATPAEIGSTVLIGAESGESAARCWPRALIAENCLRDRQR